LTVFTSLSARGMISLSNQGGRALPEVRELQLRMEHIDA